MSVDRHIRVWHILRGNARSATPGNVLFFAADTKRAGCDGQIDVWQHTLRCWSVTALRLEAGRQSRAKHVRGLDAESFWGFVVSRLDKRRPLWAFAYDIPYTLSALGFAGMLDTGLFDWQQTRHNGTEDSLLAATVTWQGLVVTKGPPCIIELRYRDTSTKVILIDTQNYWRCPLADLGRSVGVERLETPPDTAETSVWVDHCKRDVEIVRTAVVGLTQCVRANDLGNFRFTAAAQGMQAYRHRFMKHRILVHCDERTLALEREAYYGGRVSLFRSGVVAGPVYCLDIQAFYPSLMRCRLMPRYWSAYLENVSLDTLRVALTTNYCIAEVELESDDRVYPYRIGGDAAMVLGRFTASLHHADLAAALTAGHIKRVTRLAMYQQAILFGEFVDTLWTLRKAYTDSGDSVQANMIKLVMNGLAGKMGQRQITWVDVPEEPAPGPWESWTRLDYRTGATVRFRSLNWRVQVERERGEAVQSHWLDPAADLSDQPAINDEAPNSCPAIAGAITAWGRDMLGRLIDYAGIDNVYYADTDCIHVGEAGYKVCMDSGLIEDGVIGKLTVKATAGEAEYMAPKVYRLDDRVVAAGLKRQATNQAPWVWHQSIYSGWRDSCRSGIDEPLIETTQRVDLSHPAIVGEVTSDGRVLPCRVGGISVNSVAT